MPRGHCFRERGRASLQRGRPGLRYHAAYYEIIAATLGLEPRFHSVPSDLVVQADPQKAPFAQHRMYSVEKLARDTGYRPSTTVRHAIFEMVDWLQSEGPLSYQHNSPRDQAVTAACQSFEVEISQA